MLPDQKFDVSHNCNNVPKYVSQDTLQTKKMFRYYCREWAEIPSPFKHNGCGHPFLPQHFSMKA